MKRLTVIGACAVAVAAGVPALVAVLSGRSGLYGLASSSSTITPSASVDSLFALELAALTRQGISPARAGQAISVQSQVAQAGLVSKLEAAMAHAYAGVWFEPTAARLHIGVTSPASRRMAEGVVTRAGLAPDVTITPVRSTWAALIATQHQWNRKLAHLFVRAEVTTGLNAQSNAVAVTLSSSVSSRERAALEREAPTANVNIDVTVAPSSQFSANDEFNTTKCNKFATGDAECNPPLTSGVTINLQYYTMGPSVKTATCTAGPMAIPKATASKGETYLLTAGHCLAGTPAGIGSKWYAWNRAGETKEIGPAAEYVFNTKGDIGAIRIANPGYWVTTNSKDPVLAETAEWSVKNPEPSYDVEGQQPPMTGTMTCVEGQTTGQTCGTIGVTEMTVTLEGKPVEGLTEVNGTRTIKGDSGGPFLFVQTNKTDKAVLMEGTLVGGPATTKDYYEPISKALSALSKLNLELLTKGNEVRP
jgi:hypothetical protein